MSKTFEEDYLDYNSKFQKNAEQQYKTYVANNTAAGTAYVNDMNTVIDANTQRATEKIEGQISALPQHYQSGYESNAIQQKINERQLAERMANMGLTNSGLNRTQQTAINIQRSNADAALTRQKNAAMASLRSQIADVIANANSEKNTLAAQSKYDTATRNNEMYTSLMTQADQRAYDRAGTLDNQRFSAAEAEKDRNATIEQTKQKTVSEAIWTPGEWQSFFSQLRQSGGIAAAEKALEEFTQNGWIPSNMVVYASIGARGKLGH